MEKLREILNNTVREGKLLTVQPGGNHGDSLIYRGFDSLIKTMPIEQVRFSDNLVRSDTPPGIPSTDLIKYAGWIIYQLRYLRHRFRHNISAVYLHGGGNFNDLWKLGIKCYLTIGRYFECPIIIGPQSCQFNETDPTKIFKQVDNETHFFCREQYSYDIIKSAVQNLGHVNVYLDDDTALYLNAGEIPVERLTEDYTLLALRMDKESANPTINSDLDGPVRVNDISQMATTYAEWVNYAAQAKHIFTDRLHVAILGHILKKPITWYSIGYHKNRGVYEYSLSEVPEIEFVYGSN